MSVKDILEIDGKYLEGGGQILRNAISFSCILQKPVRIINIRANRPNPGLSTQHLFGLNLLADITGAQISGNHLKSTQVDFIPGRIKAGNYVINTPTAASIALILQCALPVLIFGDGNSHLEITGGTNVGMAPQVDFMTEILLPNLERFGVSFDFDLIRRGYYPRGGGCCKVHIKAVEYVSCALLTKFGHLKAVTGWCFVAGRLPAHLADDMKKAAEGVLQKVDFPIKCDIMAYKESEEMAKDNGSGVILRADTSENCILGSSSLGEKKINATALGADAASELLKTILQQICVDNHVQDQLIIYMALAKGRSSIKTGNITNHTRTAIYVAERMLPGLKFDTNKFDNHIELSCTGIGLNNYFFQ